MILVLLPLLAAPRAQELPVVVVRGDDVRVAESARVVVEAEHVADEDGDGVVQVVGDGITVVLEGHLRGAAPGVEPDEYEGIGVRVTGRDVTLRGARVSGFRAGVWATGADGLVVEDGDVSDNFRQRLRSTPAAEDPADWLRPHENDANEWLVRYGAGVWIEDARGVTVRRCRARDGQNGLVLDRVEDSRVYDVDFSFLSGWGLAMWRSSRNLVARSAFDFCVRGYSHGVYDRGQDSAGILLFEQCCENVLVENSATHSGDGFFGFAGREALGETPAPAEGFSYERRGCNDNVLVGNDFSYAAAHGIEITFSFGNRITENRLVENAICGVWGGYSRETRIDRNVLEGNGGMAYGLERGGVNVEHGRGNSIESNTFRGNACGVHLWWDEDAHVAELPWARANGVGCERNVVKRNAFEGDELAIQLRSCAGTMLFANTMRGVGRELAVEGAEPQHLDWFHEVSVVSPRTPGPGGVGCVWMGAELVPIPGRTRPVGARAHLAGRERIVMTEWGPYAWEAPHLRWIGAAEGGGDAWELLGEHDAAAVRVEGPVTAERDGRTIRVVPARDGEVAPYALEVDTEAGTLRREGAVARLAWAVRVFAYEDEAWREPARWRTAAAAGVTLETATLALRYGSGGPSELAAAPEEVRARRLPADRFGTLAETRATLPPGRWRIRTRSDDGIRLWADGELLVDDWTWHPPRTHDAVLEVTETRTIALRVEHFEIDGAALLEVSIEPAGT